MDNAANRQKQNNMMMATAMMAVNCEKFMDDMPPVTLCSASRAAEYYASRYINKHYKRTMREVKGQLMEITDRRQQYYAKRQAYDERMNFLASAYRLSRPQPCKTKAP